MNLYCSLLSNMNRISGKEESLGFSDQRPSSNWSPGKSVLSVRSMEREGLWWRSKAVIMLRKRICSPYVRVYNFNAVNVEWGGAPGRPVALVL